MYRKIISAVISALLLLMLCGCTGSQNLKQKVIVEGIGIDFFEDEFSVTVLYFKPQSPETQSEQKTLSVTVESKTLGEAFSKITASIGKEPFYANNRIVILGREAASQRLDEITDFIIRDTDMREDCYLLWSDNAKNTLENKNLSSADNNYIFTLLQKNIQNGNCAALTAMKASVNIQFGLGDIFLPRLDEQNGELVTGGTVVVLKNKGFKTIDTKNGFYLSALLNEMSGVIMSVETQNGTAAVKLLYADADIKTDDSSKTEIEIDLTVRCRVSERERSTVTDEMINSAVESTLKRGINDFLFLTAEQGIDLIGLTKLLRKQKTDYYVKYKQYPSTMISSLEFKVSTRSQILRTGRKTE